jgi:hypothetical protein
LWAAKLDTEDAHTDDAFANGETILAVADGATQSYLSGRWARFLAERVVEADDISKVPWVIQAACEAWADVLDAYKVEREEAGRPIKYYEEPKLDRGSHAALLVVELSGNEREQADAGTWRALAVGDVCIYHVSKGSFATAFPNELPSQFDTTPDLISSAGHTREMPEYKFRRGRWSAGDSFYLLSDALAHWFLLEHEERRRPWTTLDELDDQTFHEWAELERREGRIRDDDLTVTRVRPTWGTTTKDA